MKRYTIYGIENKCTTTDLIKQTVGNCKHAKYNSNGKEREVQKRKKKLKQKREEKKRKKFYEIQHIHSKYIVGVN